MSIFENLKIRNMTREEMDIAVDWAAKEGWNPGLHDAECFYRTDPSGFFMAFLEGKPVGAISAVAYDGSFGFVGFFIVIPEYRGHWIGIQLGKEALRYLEGRNVGLDGVENKIENYKSYGFKLAYHNIRYEGLSKSCHSDIKTVPISEISRNLVFDYDRRFFPVSRGKFLSLWINQPESLSLCALRKDRLAGYGLIRRCLCGYKIGPLFADEFDIAEGLLVGLISKVPSGSKFYLDIPEVNENALRLVEKYRMKPVFKTARMYNREFPDLSLKGMFGITSFELG